MSSGIPGVAEKLDLRKYLLVFRRRIWWAVIPFVVLLSAFAILCWATPYKYMASCVIRASKSEVVDLITGGAAPDKTRTSTAIVNEEMLRYDRVMTALANTDVLGDIQRRAGNDPVLRGKLEEDLYAQIRKKTSIEGIGGTFIVVNYLGDSPDRAFTVLSSLVNHFVENALAKERDDARRARDLALKDLTQSKDELESLENKLVTFNEDHPSVAETVEGGSRDQLSKVIQSLEDIDREISAKRKKLDRYIEQFEDMPMQLVTKMKTAISPEVEVSRKRLAEFKSQETIALKTLTPLHPTARALKKQIEAAEEDLANALQQEAQDDVELEPNKVRQQLEEKKLELEAELDYQVEARRNLQLRKTKLDEEVHALPGLQRELGRLKREREASSLRYDTYLKNFKRIEQDFTIKMEGLVSFSVVSQPRKPQNKDFRHIVKLAVMGLFVSLAAGVGAVAGTEFLDQSFTDVESARDVLRVPSLGVIPMIETRNDRRSRWLKFTLIFFSLFAVCAALVLLVLLGVPPFAGAASELWHQIQEFAKYLSR